jgi:putative GTP pyrophosphokinase
MVGRAKNLEWIDDWGRRYNEKRPLVDKFTRKMHALIEELLNDRHIRYSIVESRCKEVESFRRKVGRSEKDYSDPLVEVTDLTGVRVILYYHDDLPLVRSLITEEFALDESSSLDKGEVLRPHEFGYRSVHYTVSLGGKRSDLPEWKAFAQMKAEVQVRTVLQHAWAAISHAIDYKQELDVPTRLRRQLFRLSALLELGDEQFSLIRKQREEIAAQTEKEIEREDPNIEVNFDSVKEFLASSPVVSAIVAEAMACGFNFWGDDIFISKFVSHCHFLELNTIDGLKETLAATTKVSYSQYLRKLRAAESEGWTVTRSFIVLLVLLFFKSKKVSVETLVALGGWDPDTAKRVLHISKETEEEK